MLWLEYRPFLQQFYVSLGHEVTRDNKDFSLKLGNLHCIKMVHLFPIVGYFKPLHCGNFFFSLENENNTARALDEGKQLHQAQKVC